MVRIKEYKLRPQTVEAIEFTGHNVDEVRRFLGDSYFHATDEWVKFEGGGREEICCDRWEYIVKYYVKGWGTTFTCMTEDELHYAYEEVNASEQ